LGHCIKKKEDGTAMAGAVPTVIMAASIIRAVGGYAGEHRPLASRYHGGCPIERPAEQLMPSPRSCRRRRGWRQHIRRRRRQALSKEERHSQVLREEMGRADMRLSVPSGMTRRISSLIAALALPITFMAEG
jgi:hypothetical protein